MAGRPKAVQDEPQEPKSTARLIAEINKKYGQGSIGYASDASLNIKRTSSGIKTLDKALGGGFPLGRMVELYGLPSGGKSMISLLTVANAQREGLECAYIDVEGSFDPEFAESLGVDLKKLIVLNIHIGEDVFDAILTLMERDLGVIVIDSVAAMLTRAENDEDFNQQFMAIKARLMSRALPKLNSRNRGTLFLFINQIRNTLVMYGAPTTTPGGKALAFFASVRVEIKKGDLLRVDNKKTTEVIGQIVQFHVVKNKAGETPFKDGSFKFFYDGFRIEESIKGMEEDLVEEVS